MTKKLACKCDKPQLVIHYQHQTESDEWYIKCQECDNMRAGPYVSKLKAQGGLINTILWKMRH